MYAWLHRIWYEGSAYFWLLLPFSGIYRILIAIRRWLYGAGVMKTYRAPVPVIITGNITAGGTGKTPVTIWLCRQLAERGFSPGIVSRGYGGSRSSSSMRVDPASDPAVVGDEPVLLAKRTGCPVAVDPDRARAVQMLVDDGADVILADDGLQHYRLERDYEICVVDGARGLGNRRLIPAGPLREPADRLARVDQVLVNGSQGEAGLASVSGDTDSIGFDLIASEASRLDGSMSRPLTKFAGTTVHAVAAIGNPARFFDMLRSLDIGVVEHAFRDHAKLRRSDLDFGDDLEVLMTEKDAVKIDASSSDGFWFVPVDLAIDADVAERWLGRIESRLNRSKESQ